MSNFFFAFVDVQSRIARAECNAIGRGRERSCTPWLWARFLCAVATVSGAAGCPSGGTSPTSSEPTTPATTAPALRQEGSVGDGSPERKEPPPRIVPISEACRGASLRLDAELSACACDETEHLVRDGRPMARVGRWCGLPHPNETRRANLSVSAERTVLAPGEGTTVLVRLANPGPDASVYRVSNRHLWARLVLANGRPFPDAAQSSGPSNDEALFELPASGTMELRVPVSGTYERWVGTGEGASVESAKLAPGSYAIEVFLEGLGGEERRLVPVQVR